MAVGIALAAGAVVSGVAGAVSGSKAQEQSAKQTRRAAESARREAAAHVKLEGATTTGTGGATATFSPSGNGNLTNTGYWQNGLAVKVDGGGNLFVVANEKGEANQGQPVPLNRTITLGPDGSIPDLSTEGFVQATKEPWLSQNPIGQKVAPADIAAAGEGATISSDLGDLEPARKAFVDTIPENVAAGNVGVDTQIDPTTGRPTGFAEAGGFKPGTAGFDQLQEAQGFADAAGAQLPQTEESLLGQQTVGAELQGTGQGQFEAGFDPSRTSGFSEASIQATQAASQGFDSASADRLALLREQAAPAQQRLIDSIAQSAFGKGQLGGAGGREALRVATEQIGQQDLGFQLAGQDLGRGLQADATTRAGTFAGAVQGDQAAGTTAFGTGASTVSAANQGLLDVSNVIADRGAERFQRAGESFTAIGDAQTDAFAQTANQRDAELLQMRANIGGEVAERDAAFGRATTATDASLAFGGQDLANRQLALQVAQAEGNQALGVGSNQAAISTAQINSITPNTAVSDAFGGLSSALGTAAGSVFGAKQQAT